METATIWEFRDDLATMARSLCRNPSDAEDVAHNALVRAASGLSRCQGEATDQTWLQRIAAEECWATHRTRRTQSLEAMVERTWSEEEDRSPSPADTLPGPEEATLEGELREDLLAALARIPRRYRCALLLKEAGASLECLADALGTSVSAAKSLIYRARDALREEMHQFV